LGGVKSIEDAKADVYNYLLSRPGIFAIEFNRKCIGAIDLRLVPEHKKAGFGYVLNREFWGQGIMTEALSALLRLCFEKLELNRVEEHHYAGNEGSGRVMQKCGMIFEGLSPQAERVKGVFRDVVRYGITREQWLSLGK